MTIQDLGYNEELANYRKEHQLNKFEIGRIISEHKDRYVINTGEIEYDAELIGNIRFTAESRYDFPAVGDWVAFSEYDTNKALIHAIFPRASIIERKLVGKLSEIQIIASNIDYGLIVQAVDNNFNLNRLERYLTLCYASDVKPIVVLSKIDLIKNAELESLINEIQQRIKETTIVTVSSETKGYNDLGQLMEKGKTYCLLGSSGVGKSTILNNLSRNEKMKTGEISASVNKGKHITSHRELILLDNGAILIDNPGMREVGIADTSVGLETTFEQIIEFAKNCKFKDCTHSHEKDCAIIEALEKGELDKNAYDNYQKMEREKVHFESNVHERRKKDKAFGKMIKGIKKQRKNKKY